MAANYELVRQQVELVRTETEDFANTAERVGGAMAGVLEVAHDEVLRATEAEDVLRAIVMQNVEDIRGMKPNLEAAVSGMLANTDAIESLQEDAAVMSGDVSTLEANLEAETTRAQEAEQALSTEITEAENRVDERVTEVRDALDEEVSRAMTAERANMDAIGAEVERAEAEEKLLRLEDEQLAEALGEEISRAEAAERANAAAIAETNAKVKEWKETTEEELEGMIENGTWEEGVIYFTVES